MNNVGGPSQFLHSLDHSAGKEEGTLVIIIELLAGSVSHSMFSLEIILVVDEINLHPGRLYGCDFYDQRMIGVVDDEIHPGKPDHLVQLVPSLVYAAIARHKCPNLFPSVLNSLREIPSNL